MDNELSNNIKQVTESSKAVNPQTQVTTSTPAEPTKSNKALIVILSIFLVLSLGAAAAFAYLYFSNNTQNTPTSTPTPETPVSGETKEVEITDTYVLRDLDEKMAILHRTSETGQEINKGNVGGYYADLTLYETGNLPVASKVTHVIDFLSNSFRALSADEMEAVRPKENAGGQELITYGIDYDTVADKYKDLFNEDLPKQSFGLCYHYQYNEEYNFFYKDPNVGCGGTSQYARYYYKNRYTELGDNSYVYVSAATLNLETNEIYCDLISFSDDGTMTNKNLEVCSTSDNVNNFPIDESNYQDFAEYRFIFHKADDGTYYFEKVEQL